MIPRSRRSWSWLLSVALSACVADRDRDVTTVGDRRLEPPAPASVAAEPDQGVLGDEVGADGARRAPAREGCNAAEVLRPSISQERVLLSRRGSTTGATATSESALGNCREASAGPEVWYELDLRALPRAVEFRATLDAAFDAALDLRRGACGDTLSVDCDRADALDRPGSALAARLAPGVHWLVVDGATASSQGEFALELELDVEIGDCESLPLNRGCDSAARLEPLSFQTVLMDLSCAESSTYGDFERLYHELDLSQEPEPVLVTSSIWTLREERPFASLRWYRIEPGSSVCGSELYFGYVSGGSAFMAAAQGSLLLTPGRYILAAEVDASDLEDKRAQLSLRLDRETCRRGARGDSCATAIELDPSAAVQLIDGSTSCNTNQLTPECAGDAPDQFYRLDLRGSAGTTLVRAAILADETDFEPVLYLLSPAEDGACGEPSYCADPLASGENLPLFDLTLRPGLYFIGVDGAESGAAGHYRLLLELSPTQPSPCINAAIATCALDESSGPCCAGLGPRCDVALELCGLAPATRACVCTQNPACCGPDRWNADCAESHQACQYLCPDFVPLDRGCY